MFDLIVGLMRLSTVIPLVVWTGIAIYWARKERAVYRWMVSGALSALTLSAIEASRRRFDIFTGYQLDPWWNLFVNILLTVSIWGATIAASWSLWGQVNQWIGSKVRRQVRGDPQT